MRSLGISVISLALTTAVIGNAYYQKKQFYPSVVYITKSNPSMAVIYLQAFILVLLMGKLMRKVFFGQLRTAEFEHLMERSWYAITETCLAFTVFRDDFNPKFVALFTVLFFLKSFHWLAEDRVDYMERSPVISLLFHIRVLSLLLILGALDLHFVGHAYQSTVTKGASVQLVFGFEYAILITMVVNVAIKYALHSVDLNSETPWDNKAVFLLYTELVMGFIKVILYIAFVAIMVRIYTLPLFAFRPMYYTMRNFKKAFNDVILSRRAIHNMNTLYPDATPEELIAADNVCIICREEMTTASKKLPCNHIFHTSCLRSWFQRQQTCPTCRLNILRPPAAAGMPRGGAAAAQGQRQQQRAPVAPAHNNPFAAAGPNPFQNIINAAHAQQQQQAPAQAAAQGAGAAVTNAAVPQPPLMIPPFPFLPFMAPPPMPPQNLRSLTPEELRRIEGNERENIEARIQCLRNIQIMLDASVLMMQQYSAAAAIAASTQQSTFLQQVANASGTNTTLTNSPAADSTATAAQAAAAAAANTPSTSPSTSTSNPPAKTSAPTETTASTSAETNGHLNAAETPAAAATASGDSGDDVSSSSVSFSNGRVSGEHDDEVRRRRLQKFAQAAAEQQAQQ